MTTETVEKQATTQAADAGQVESRRSGRTYRPQVDIAETAAEVTLTVDMPGVKQEAIELNFEEGELTVRGTVAPRHGEDTRYLLREYGVGDFQRVFRVGEQIDVAGIAANYAHGVLTVHLPKLQAAQPRKITVNAS
jgi:HSP20 family protein